MSAATPAEIELSASKTCADHTPTPNGDQDAYNAWVRRMQATHRQILCGECSRYRIWVPKEALPDPAVDTAGLPDLAATPADVYERAADIYVENMPGTWLATTNGKVAQYPAFRAAVDAAFAAGRAADGTELAEARVEQEKLATTGTWVTQQGVMTDCGFLQNIQPATHQRQVWYGEVTAIDEEPS